MRIALYILLFANLAFLAWGAWIDAPPRPPATASETHLPKLVLASEAEAKVASGSPAQARTGTPAAAARCVSVGPFNSAERVEGAMSILRGRGFTPREREEPGEERDGFWVYVGGLQSAAEEARVLRTLTQAGLNDARIMPESDAGRRVSVGLFSERTRAERRARALRRLGLEPEIGERHVPGSVYWADIDLGPDDSSVSTEGLLAPEEAGARLEVRVCPAG